MLGENIQNSAVTPDGTGLALRVPGGFVPRVWGRIDSETAYACKGWPLSREATERGGYPLAVVSWVAASPTWRLLGLQALAQKIFLQCSSWRPSRSKGVYIYKGKPLTPRRAANDTKPFRATRRRPRAEVGRAPKHTYAYRASPKAAGPSRI